MQFENKEWAVTGCFADGKANVCFEFKVFSYYQQVQNQVPILKGAK